MAISYRVCQEFYEPVSNHGDTPNAKNKRKTKQQLIRLSLTTRKSESSNAATSPDAEISLSSSESQSPAESWSMSGPIRIWTDQEHERFLEALEMHPRGPWKRIAEHVGNKTARQVMSHAQKYRQKIARRKRGLKKTRERRKTANSKTNNTVSDVMKQDGIITSSCVPARRLSPLEILERFTNLEWSPVISSEDAISAYASQDLQLLPHQVHHIQDEGYRVQNHYNHVGTRSLNSAICPTTALCHMEPHGKIIMGENVNRSHADDSVALGPESLMVDDHELDLLLWELFQ